MRRFASSFLPGRRFVAGLLLAHVLMVLALAASPRLHHWVHPDADDDGHDCAVVLFTHGGGDTPPTPMVATAFSGLEPVTFVVGGPLAAFVPPVFVANRVFEHGPPVVG